MIVPRALAATGAAVVLATAVVLAATGEPTRAPAYWTVRQAESIASVRRVPLHVEECRGTGPALQRAAVARYARFSCTAGTGLDREPFDSVAVTYELVPEGRYEGTRSEYSVRDVRFVGGTGIP